MVNGFTQKEVPDSAIYYDIPEYRPFWSAVHDLDVPFYLHPRRNIPSRAYAYDGHPWLLSPAWDFAVQTADHTIRLICSGLFDEFPGLRMILGHLGERLPFDMWRIDNLMRHVPGGIPAKRPVGDYLRSNFHLTTSGQFHDPPFRCALAEMGVDRILFSIDYPFEEFADAASWFEGTDLSDEDRRKIGCANAIELFKLDLS
jgi:2,3-dihydroxybenzoate decarboxylase